MRERAVDRGEKFNNKYRPSNNNNLESENESHGRYNSGRKFSKPEAKFLICDNKGEDPVNSKNKNENLGLKYIDSSINSSSPAASPPIGRLTG